MAEARSGVARSGDTYSGDASLEPLTITIGGVDVTRQTSDLEVAMRLNQPWTASAETVSSSLTAGAAVGVWRGGVDVGVPLFGGHLLQPSPKAARFAERISVSWTATDLRWRMAQEALVTIRLAGVGVNTAVRTILTQFAPATITAGYLPSTLGDIGEMQFTNERLDRAIDRIAAQVEGGAYWEVSPTGVVSMWPASADPPHLAGAALAVTNASTHRHPQVDLDMTNIRTRVICEGGGSATTAVTAAGATTVSVEETGWYLSTGGGARAGQVVFDYTGVSTASGPGDLTGCTGITDDIPQGEVVVVRQQADDSAAQTDLAGILGGTGIAVHRVSDGRINATSAAQRALAELEFYKAAVRAMTYTTDEDVHTVPGRTVAVSITAPATIQQDVRVQRVTVRKFGAITTTATSLERAVETSPTAITLAHMLRGGE